MSNILHKDKHQNQLLIPMKTLKFLVVVVTFLDGDICGHFVGVQSAPCSGLSPLCYSLSVSTSVSVSASVSQPVSHRDRQDHPTPKVSPSVLQ